jgi:taurine dioxygenase
MRIEPASDRVGAIVTGLDMTRMTDEEWRTLYQAWLDRLVLIVRDQDFTVPQFLAVAERFGRLMPHVVRRTRNAQYPQLTEMGLNTKKADGKVDTSIYARGQGWHTDGPWDWRGTCKATQLYGLEIPSVGGDTWFANMYAAAEALPADLRARLAGVKAEYVYGGHARKGNDLLEPEDRDHTPVAWPVLRVHPETGRTALYINPTHFLRFAGMAPEASDALFEELAPHMIKPEWEYHHAWRRHDYVIWDNRCSNHAAAGGYPIEERRIHWRATILE